MMKTVNELDLEVIRLRGEVRLLEVNQKWLLIAIVLLVPIETFVRLVLGR